MSGARSAVGHSCKPRSARWRGLDFRRKATIAAVILHRCRTPAAHFLATWPRLKKFSDSPTAIARRPWRWRDLERRRSCFAFALPERGDPRNRALPERSALAGGTPAQPHSRPPTRFLRSGRSGDNVRIAVSKAGCRASEDDRRDPRTPGHTLWAGTDVYAHAAESLGCDTRRDCNQSALRHVKGSLDGFASN